jgi:hypothetical protein
MKKTALPLLLALLAATAHASAPVNVFGDMARSATAPSPMGEGHAGGP